MYYCDCNNYNQFYLTLNTHHIYITHILITLTHIYIYMYVLKLEYNHIEPL